ncbi:flagellar hook-basal body complex protein FliE [Psychromarinibacter halotolerans]|uniref:Flagellar hook-basal body complex protein FliE n=1 Tax=Psychromarinibacter halotolerans TaxID=1775175 RepID=A0ABV7GK21_9RHOB|nr:flagellar hook-basal body complex protein FliE [Psychromarinibacter halotolerans]MAQ86008.1 flagellar hook-basal body protein FliE [Maritimibacter sp.]MDF0595808.1 flagellar hook-basal body complex protein FliE [Psychromarinibacter halotolerans]
MDSLTSAGALRAYKAAQSAAIGETAGEFSTDGPSFSDVLERTARDTIATVRDGDRAAIAGLKGEISTQQVVEATMAMEAAIDTAVAVRDKVVSAYQEVLRMAV